MKLMTVPHHAAEWKQLPDPDLLSSEITFQSVFKHHPEPMMLFHYDHLVYVNKSVCDLFLVRSGADFMTPGLDELLPPTMPAGASLRQRFGQYISHPESMKSLVFSWACNTRAGKPFVTTVKLCPIPAVPFDLTLVLFSSN